MKVVSFVTEYNPYHYGHKYHLEQSLVLTEASHSIAIMSGSFVQRGEPSIVDKWTKAKMAIDNGVDLVIELPFVFSTQSAELFALGGIKIMEALNIVDFIAFGSEIGDLKPLHDISTLLVEEPKKFKLLLKKNLDLGMSFASARSLAINDYLKHSSLEKYDYESILKQSNNILAIEYLKALARLNSRISPVIIKRQGSDYKDEVASNRFSSATAIRKTILDKGHNSVEELLPSTTYRLLESFYHKHNRFNQLENYYPILKYLLLTIDKKKLKRILDMENGLENRIVEKSYSSTSLTEIIDNSVSKRYPKTRIQRILIHLLSGISGSSIKSLYSKDLPYIRVLAANNKGLELLSAVKKNSTTPILTKFSHIGDYEDETAKEFASYEIKATDLYYLGLNTDHNYKNMDYKTSPYIKK